MSWLNVVEAHDLSAFEFFLPRQTVLAILGYWYQFSGLSSLAWTCNFMQLQPVAVEMTSAEQHLRIRFYID